MTEAEILRELDLRVQRAGRRGQGIVAAELGVSQPVLSRALKWRRLAPILVKSLGLRQVVSPSGSTYEPALPPTPTLVQAPLLDDSTLTS